MPTERTKTIDAAVIPSGNEYVILAQIIETKKISEGFSNMQSQEHEILERRLEYAVETGLMIGGTLLIVSLGLLRAANGLVMDKNMQEIEEGIGIAIGGGYMARKLILNRWEKLRVEYKKFQAISKHISELPKLPETIK